MEKVLISVYFKLKILNLISNFAVMGLLMSTGH